MDFIDHLELLKNKLKVLLFCLAATTSEIFHLLHGTKISWYKYFTAIGTLVLSISLFCCFSFSTCLKIGIYLSINRETEWEREGERKK